MAGFLYNDKDLTNVLIILRFINDFTNSMGIKNVAVDPDIVQKVVNVAKSEFPQDGGIQTASAFKQVGYFVCYFVAERPILEPFPSDIIGEQLANIPNHQNAMVAFGIAEAALFESRIKRNDGDFLVKNPIVYSRHSYIDIVDSLASLAPAQHWKLVTVLLEQLVYKSNPDCQYPLM